MHVDSSSHSYSIDTATAATTTDKNSTRHRSVVLAAVTSMISYRMAGPIRGSPTRARRLYTIRRRLSVDCRNAGQTPCYNFTEPGGLTERMLVAYLTDRRPLPERSVSILPDTTLWAMKYTPNVDLGSAKCLNPWSTEVTISSTVRSPAMPA